MYFCQSCRHLIPRPAARCMYCGGFGTIEDMSGDEHARYYVHLAARGWEGTFDELRAKALWAQAEDEPGMRQMMSESLVGQQPNVAPEPAPRRVKKSRRGWYVVGVAVFVLALLGHGNPIAGFHAVTSGVKTVVAWVVGLFVLYLALIVLSWIAKIFGFAGERKAARRDASNRYMQNKVLQDEMRRRRIY